MAETVQKSSFWRRGVALLDRWVPEYLKASPPLFRKARLTLWFAVLVIFQSLGYSAFYISIGHIGGAAICLYAIISAVFLIFYFHKTGNFLFSGNFFAFSAFTFFAMFCLFAYGLNTLISAWLLLVPLSAFLLANIRSGAIWSIIIMIWVVVMYFLGDVSQYFPPIFSEESIPIVNLAVLQGLILFVVMALWYYESGRQKSEYDIETARKRVEQTNLNLEHLVSTRTRDLEEKNSELDVFLYQSSHALKRPLARASGLISLLSPDTDKQDFQFIKAKSDQTFQEMETLLHHLVNISEVLRRTSEPEWQEVSPVVEKSLEAARRLTPDSPVEIRFSGQKGLTAQFDAYILGKAILEVCLNARKLPRPGEATPLLMVLIESDGSSVSIRFHDNGIGIPESFIDKAFDMFSRGTVQSSGNGLGLYLVKICLQKLRGEVSLESEEGKYSEVIITLPKKFIE